MSIAADRLKNDRLYGLLRDGAAEPDDQKRATEWLDWMAQFVPDDAARDRLDGIEKN